MSKRMSQVRHHSPQKRWPYTKKNIDYAKFFCYISDALFTKYAVGRLKRHIIQSKGDNLNISTEFSRNEKTKAQQTAPFARGKGKFLCCRSRRSSFQAPFYI